MDGRAERRREQIVEAAVGCFAARGFHQTTMPEICRAAGMSAGSLYRYFRSKEEIIEAIVDWDLAQSIAGIARAAQAGNAVAALSAVGAAWLADLDDPGAAALQSEIVAEAGRNPRIAEAVVRHDAEVVGALAETVARGQDLGEVQRGVDPEIAATLIVALLDGLALRKGVAPALDLNQYAAPVGRLIARLLARDEEGA